MNELLYFGPKYVGIRGGARNSTKFTPINSE